MKYTRFSGAASAALIIVIALTVVLQPDAEAQSKFKTLHKFHGKGGIAPYASLVFDQTGNLYGTTSGGGAYGEGAIFRLTPNGHGLWTESVLYSFCPLTGCADGSSPDAGLIFDRAGNLYGTTFAGGNQPGCTGIGGCGVVFKLTPNSDGSWKESIVHSFFSCGNCNDGVAPSGGVVFDQTGNLYGTTQFGGAYNGGIVFQLTLNLDGSWTESVLHDFKEVGTEGGDPQAGVILDTTGNLYGTASVGGGGAYLSGTVFKLAPNADGSWTESTLYSFCSVSDCTDGQTPFAGLVFDQAGNLYGTTRDGGSAGQGVVFKLAQNSEGIWTESVLFNFAGGKDGGVPYAGLIFDPTGNLYGTTLYGGDVGSCINGWGCGVVFKLASNSNGVWHQRVLHVFFDRPGAYPYVSVILDAAGNLYGTTSGDGSTTFGSVFEITP